MGISPTRETQYKWLLKASKADTMECMEWTHEISTSGYGRVTKDRRTLATHRVAFEVAYGPIPAGMLVCHRCDNPKCFNPKHLFLGTDADNHRDRHAKGRDARGEGHRRSKLSEQAVREIRASYSPERTKELVSKYGVHQTTICAVAKRRAWAWLD